MGAILRMINSHTFRDSDTTFFVGSDPLQARLDFLQVFSDGLRDSGTPDEFLRDFEHWLRKRFAVPDSLDWRAIIEQHCRDIDQFLALVENFTYLPE